MTNAFIEVYLEVEKHELFIDGIEVLIERYMNET